MNKRILLSLLGLILVVIATRIYYKFNLNTSPVEPCLANIYNNEFKNLEELEINSEYNFDTIFNCNDWDEILVMGGPIFNRGIFYLTSGIIIPEYDYTNSLEGTYFLFFIKGNEIISGPIHFGSPYFIFSQNFNKSNYLKLNRKRALFKYVRFEDSDFEMFTLELIGNESN